MSLYIHSENQKILWDSIQKSPLCNLCFNNDEQKNLWFKSIIRLFYEKNPNKIGNVELTEMNHKTIVYMLNDMKTLITTLQTTSNTISNSSTPTISTPYTTPNIYNYDKNKERDERIKSIETRLVEKQYEMESLLKRQSPPEIDFRMVEKDEPILNIDELLQKHIKERELYQEIPQQLHPTESHITHEIPPIESEILQISDNTEGTHYTSVDVELSYKLDKLMDMMKLIDYKLNQILNKETVSVSNVEQVENIQVIIEENKEQVENIQVIEKEQVENVQVEIEQIIQIEIEPVEKKTEFKRGRGRGRGKR